VASISKVPAPVKAVVVGTVKVPPLIYNGLDVPEPVPDKVKVSLDPE
jgi:hypothetical protein